MILIGNQLSTVPAESVSLEEGQRIVKILEEELKISSIPGIGLAAPQIGINKMVAIIRIPQSNTKIDLINPELITAQGIITCEEGCLSFPNHSAKTSRFDVIEIETFDSYYNGMGRRRIVANELDGLCIQHEYGHLIGKTMYDFFAKEVGRNSPCPCASGKKNKKCHNLDSFNPLLLKLGVKVEF